MAENMVLFHQTEAELETEIKIDKTRTKPTTKIGKIRRRGEHLLHGKYVLLAIIILNVLDCLLVLGELMLDIKYVTDLLTREYERSEDFIYAMKTSYPARLGYLGRQDIEALEHEILMATLYWNNSNTENDRSNYSRDGRTLSKIQSTPTLQMTVSTVRKRRSLVGQGNNTYPRASRYTNVHHDPTRSVQVQIVTGLHKTSISILIILVCETIFKIFCFGRQMLQYKLECFDGFVVIASFIVDVLFIKGIQQFTVQQYILILALIVPWRIIRVVNSLVVAINCHEHFRLVTVYKQTKKISADLKDVKADNKAQESCIEFLVKMCVDAGLPDALVKTKLEMYKKEITTEKSKAKGKVYTEGMEMCNKILEDENHIIGVDNIVVRM